MFQVTKEELAKLVQGFEKQDILTSSGVTLAGNRYIYLSGTDRVVRAKLGKVGVHCMKTQQGEYSLSQTNKHMQRDTYLFSGWLLKQRTATFLHTVSIASMTYF